MTNHTMRFNLDPKSFDYVSSGHIKIVVHLGRYMDGGGYYIAELTKDNLSGSFTPRSSLQKKQFSLVATPGSGTAFGRSFSSRDMEPRQYYCVENGDLTINLNYSETQEGNVTRGHWTVTPGNTPQTWLRLGKPGVWAETAAMTAIGKYLYVVQKDRLWKVNSDDGGYVQLGTDSMWGKTAAMTSQGESLYVVQRNQLWEADQFEGNYIRRGHGRAMWAKTAAMTATRSTPLHLKIIQNSQLWHVNRITGNYVRRGTGAAEWGDTAAMTFLGRSLYAIQRGQLYLVNPKSGGFKPLGPAAWKETAAMTAMGKNLYVVQKDQLWMVDPKDGDYKKLGTGEHWPDTAAMTASAESKLRPNGRRYIYIIQGDSLWAALTSTPQFSL